jgi:hypothetical protein
MSPKQKTRRSLVYIALFLLVIGIPLDFFILKDVGLKNIRIFPINEKVSKAVLTQNEKFAREVFHLDSCRLGTNRILDDGEEQYVSLVIFGKPNQKDSMAYLVLIHADDKNHLHMLCVQPSSIPPDPTKIAELRRTMK